jgi:hypothetical protein
VTNNVKYFGFENSEVPAELEASVLEFCDTFDPLERTSMIVLVDDFTGAAFTECHVSASIICSLGTTDVPLDPDESPEYRANRDIVISHSAFEQMKSDAISGRKFSNIVCEFSPSKEKSLEVVGGQHRFEAILSALAEGQDVHHGVKVYFSLTKEQRLDVQVISNTNISVPTDLLDRMYATLEGADLRVWCQKVDLLEKGQDFADKNKRGNPITVKEARTFIVNYWLGKEILADNFNTVDTTPQVVESGKREPKLWKEIKDKNLELWSDKGLLEAGKQFARLINAQREYFRDTKSKKLKGKVDHIYKTKNVALLAGWAFVSGALQSNATRLAKHYALADDKAKDPLRADLLANGKHGTDPEAYRGLGFRSDPKERGRFTELFWLHAEKGGGFSAKLIDTAIKGYEAKRAHIAFVEGKAKL